VTNAAKMTPGQSVAIFGLGGVGLSAVMGAVLAGVAPVIAIDPLPAKLELARKLGANHLLNPSQDDPAKAIVDLTGGGVDVAIEAVGSAKVLSVAYASVRRGGMAVTVGLPHPDETVTLPALSLAAQEKSIRGSYMGSSVPRQDIPRLIELYLHGRLPVDLLLSQPITLHQINSGFDLLQEGVAVRQLVRFS
jgi:alcohol dehydrogenase